LPLHLKRGGHEVGGIDALGLSARPFGGVFDGLLNRALGLTGPDEQFLLAVLVGHQAGSPGP